MQYQKLRKTVPTPPTPTESYQLHFHSYFAGDLFFEDPQSKFPTSPHYTKKTISMPTKRELFKIRLFLRIERDRLPNQEHTGYTVCPIMTGQSITPMKNGDWMR